MVHSNGLSGSELRASKATPRTVRKLNRLLRGSSFIAIQQSTKPEGNAPAIRFDAQRRRAA